MTLETEKISGTVKLYHRHLLVCTGHTHWPSQVEQEGIFLQTLAKTISARTNEMSMKVKLTACDTQSKNKGHDVMIFPEKIYYSGVLLSQIPNLVEEQLVKNRICRQIRNHSLSGQYVLICVHGKRDLRCGDCGPPLASRFEEELATRKLTHMVSVQRTSHIGGHRFAGNVIIYPGGDWYGRVTPRDVPRIVDNHILNGQVVPELWRGKMGLSVEKQLSQLV